MNIEKLVKHGCHFVKISKGDKIPAQPWKDTKPPTLDEIYEWIESGYNLAVKTGEQFFVVDVDNKKIANSFCKQYNIPKTLVVESPRGYHFYFKSPDFQVKNAVAIIENVDIRAKGGYIIVPPSVVKNKVYCTIRDNLIAGATEELLTLLRPKPRPETKEFTYKGDMRKYEKAALISEVDAVLTAPDGTRNDTLHKASFNLSTIASLNEGIIRAKLTMAGIQVGLSEGEILATLNSGIASGRVNLRGQL